MPAKRLLLLGTGGIAAHHVDEFAQIPDCRIVACADAVAGRAAEFARRHRIDRPFDSLDKAIAWGEFDAAINATPDGAHKETTMALIAAGKHVFCEKPLAQNHADALAMTEAAESAGLMNMVNLTYRNSPALQEARAIMEAGELGELRQIDATYRQSWLVSKAWGDWRTDPKWLWRLSTKHGSMGVLGDVGIHILDFASYAANDDIAFVKADLATFPKVDGDRIGDYELDANDTYALAARMTKGATLCVIATRYSTGHMNDLFLSLHGTKGALQVTTDGRQSRLRGCIGKDIEKARWRTLTLPPVKRNAARFARSLATGVNGDPSFRRAAQLQKVIDASVVSNERDKLIRLT